MVGAAMKINVAVLCLFCNKSLYLSCFHLNDPCVRGSGSKASVIFNLCTVR